MDMFAGIKTFLFVLSSCVLYPVLLLLTGLSAWIFFECGKLLADWVRRRRLRNTEFSAPVEAYRKTLAEMLSRHAPEHEIQNFLRESIHRRQAFLDKFRIVTRIGPALGLIGTLVPMGTALASLGQGDVSVMTAELVVAYTTTVVGLLVSCLSFLIYTIRYRFVENDIRNMEFLTEQMYHEIHA
jgi:biopolymer transport protein ExbB/TolQ